LLDELAEYGFVARIQDALDLAAGTRVLLLKHASTGTPVDVMLGLLPYEERMVAEATMVRHGALAVPVISAESLCVMKMLAQRPRDIADLDAILFANPSLNRDRVMSDMSAISSLLEEPGLQEFARSFLRTHPPENLDSEPPPA